MARPNGPFPFKKSGNEVDVLDLLLTSWEKRKKYSLKKDGFQCDEWQLLRRAEQNRGMSFPEVTWGGGGSGGLLS